MGLNKKSISYVVVIFFAVCWLVYNQSLLLAPVDTGDGLLHFFISQASWENPNYFLDHWGKPLFIALSSPFAQLGYVGMFQFNVLTFICTTIFGWLILQKLNVNKGLALCFPLLLLLTYDYVRTISGGLTEPLFSLFLLIGSWFWLKDKYLLASLFIGCLLFLRSEGQLTVLLFLGLLIYAKQWRAILFLTTPFIIYSVIGLITLHDFFWYFNQSPYEVSNNTYGAGDYNHYLMSYKNFLGNHGLFLFLGSIPMIFASFWSKKVDFKLFGVIFISFGTFFGIIAAHSYFWGSGTHGSMGLTRIATQALPSFLIVSLYFLSQYAVFSSNKGKFLGYIFGVGMLIQLCVTPFLKKTIDPTEFAIQQLYKENHYQVQGSPLVTTNIYFAELFGRNPLTKSKPETTILSKEILVNNTYSFEKGSYFLWDNYSGPVELNVSYSLIANYPGMELQGKIENEGVIVCLFIYNPE
ncbi:MAG: hypothetical protein ACSHXL_05400 [Bacteroidota bacterium]